MSIDLIGNRTETCFLRRPEVDSTNAEAARLVAAGQAAPFWVLADRQTGGRGRRGRAWASLPGNFFGSLVVDAGADPGRAALRSFVAALALAEAFDAAGIPPRKTALKWPNDVLVEGRKVAGILLETAVDATGAPRLIVGIGVNILAAPEAATIEPGAVPPTTLAAHDAPIAPDALAALVDTRFHHHDAVLRTQGFAPIRAAWLARAARLGEVITARLPHGSVTGRFRTLDGQGALMLDTAQGPRSITAADISFEG